MAVAHDAQTRFPATTNTSDTVAGDRTFTHTPSGVPKGVICVIHCNVGAAPVTGILYGGVAMTLEGFCTDLTEVGRIYIYTLLSSVPTGAVTVTLQGKTAAREVWCTLSTVTASTAATQLVGETFQDTQTTTNPSINVVTTDTALLYGAVHGGAAAPTSYVSGSGYTTQFDHDGGTLSDRSQRRTSPVAAGTIVFNFTYGTSDDWCMAAVAIAELPPTPVIASTTYRYRNDDGSQTAATWKAAANTEPTDITPGHTFRFRADIRETAGGNPASALYYLTCNLNGSAFWIEVDSLNGNVEPTTSAHVSDGAATTQQITSGTFQAGEIDTSADDNLTDIATDLAPSTITEHEWVIRTTNIIIAGDIIKLRVVRESDSAIMLETGAFTVISGVTGTEYTDSGTALLKFTVSATEEHTTFDSASVRLTLTPGGSELRGGSGTFGYRDVAVTPSSKGADFKVGSKFTLTQDARLYKITPYIDIVAGTGGADSRCAVYRVSDGVLMGVTVSQFISGGGASGSYDHLFASPLALTGGVEYWLHWHTGVYTGTATFNWMGDAIGTNTFHANPDTFTDGSSDPIGTNNTGNPNRTMSIYASYFTDVPSTLDVDTVPLKLTPSGSDVYTGATVYTDSGTALLGLVPSGTELLAKEYVDSGTALFKFTPSATEAQDAVDSNTAALRFTPSGTELLAKEYLDAATASLTFSVSATEGQHYTDTTQVRLSFVPSGTDERTYFDAATGLITFTPSGTDTAQYVETGSVLLDLQPSGSDIYTPLGGIDYVDSGSVRLTLTPSGTDTLRTDLEEKILLRRIKPDGTYLHFYADPNGTNLNEIQLPHPHQPTVPMKIENARFSPDGNKIAWAHFNGTALYVADVDGQNTIIIDSTPPTQDNFSQPHWSPDGKKIAYIHKHAGGTQIDWVYICDADGSNKVHLTLPSSAYHYAGLEWSKDGTRLAVSGVTTTTAARGNRIWVVRIADEAVLLTQDLTSNPGTWVEIQFQAWDHFTDKLIYILWKTSEPYSEIWQMDPDGTNKAQVVTPDPDYQYNGPLTVSPDGQKLAFNGLNLHPWDSNFAFTTNRDGTSRQILTPVGEDWMVHDWEWIAPVDYLWQDTGTASLRFTPSATEEHVTFDADTARLSLTPSATENTQTVDVTSVLVDLQPSAVDTAQFADAASVLVDLQPSGTEFITSGYTDTGTVPVLFTPRAVTETLTGIDVGSILLDLQPSGSEQFVSGSNVDADTIILRFTPRTVSDIYYFFDALLVGTLSRRWDGTLQRRWQTPLFTSKWSAVMLNRKWSGVLGDTRWSATIVATSKWSGTLVRKWTAIYKGRGEP